MTVLTRRRFLQGTSIVAGALVIGFRLDGRPAAAAEGLAPNAFIRIAPDNTITIISKHIELGQGSYSGLATILAEELDADWAQIRVEAAPADAQRYGNRLLGGAQVTGGSTAMAEAWDQLRRAGATARAMLVEAAAREWSVPAAAIAVDGGVLSHPPSGRRATFGELASKAAALTPPAQVALKDPRDFTLVGKRIPRVDGKAKTDGSAQFTADYTAPGLLTALIARPPRFGATVKSVDGTAARRVKGVTHVVQVPSGVAVVATGFWAARKGREALRVTWDESRAERRGTDGRRRAGGAADRAGGRERAVPSHRPARATAALRTAVGRRHPDDVSRRIAVVVGVTVVLVASVARADEHRALRAPGAFAGIADPAARSAALFVEAGKVLQHPRCLNCHPDGDRPSQGRGYPHQPPVQRGPDGHGVAAMRCATCHQKANFDPGRVPGHPEWHLAPLSMAWQRKSLAEICLQLKDPARNGGKTLKEIVEHMAHDSLVGWGWKPGAGREPAPGTQASFGALVKAWADSGAACPTR